MPKYTYSTNEEEYSGEYDTPEEAAKECFEQDDDCQACRVGEAVKPELSGGICARKIIDDIIENREDEYSGEWAEAWSSMMAKLPNEVYEELNGALAAAVDAWVKKHGLEATFFNVENAKTYTREQILTE